MGENCSCNGRHLNLRSTSRRVLACASVAAGLMAVLATASAAVPAHADALRAGSEADRADAAALEVVLPDPFDQTATCESCHVFEDVTETKAEEAPAAKGGDAVKEDGDTAKEGDQAPAPSADEELLTLHPAVGCTSCHEADEWLEKAHRGRLDPDQGAQEAQVHQREQRRVPGLPWQLGGTCREDVRCGRVHRRAGDDRESSWGICVPHCGRWPPQLRPVPQGARRTDEGRVLDEAASKACITCHHNNEYVACTECHAS